MLSTHLALVELVHSLCDPIAIIHPHHPGKPRDKACITWGRRRSVSPAGPHLPWGCQGSLCSLLPLPKEEWALRVPTLGKGPAAASSLGLPGPLGPWWGGTHLRWPCAGSAWGGPAGAACGTCPRRVSPASGRGVGTRPSCSGTAEMGRRRSLPSPCQVWLGWGLVPVFLGCPSVTWYCPGASQAGAVFFQASSPNASRSPGCPRSLESPFLPGGQGA